MKESGHFFSKNQGTIFQFLKKGRGDLPTPPASFTHVKVNRITSILYLLSQCLTDSETELVCGKKKLISKSKVWIANNCWQNDIFVINFLGDKIIRIPQALSTKKNSLKSLVEKPKIKL